MPKRSDLKKILIVGSGPIVIGQACEFDYSGAQACKALKNEGYQVVLVNSNPATIMTDPEMAHRTYIEPLTIEFLERIIEKERPCAILPTMGGQTALNLAMGLSKEGVLKKYDVELIGANEKAIEAAESRESFKKILEKCNVECPKSGLAHTLEQAEKVLETVGLPCVIRPSFTLGGTGAAFCYTKDEFVQEIVKGLEASPVSEVLVEESVLGWKEFELELMRDKNDNVVIICSIENLDPMGVHTGDSITVAPIQTLTDVEYQKMRTAAIRIIREVGVDTGGSNIQFAVHPKNGRQVAIEMNPRVSRSSALASKATGYPIAKIAAQLAIGYTLDELKNDITKKSASAFEPSLDYVVTKIPRFNFDKFPRSDTKLTPSMKSVGEVMAIGRNFQESIQKALRSLEIKLWGFNPISERRKIQSPGQWQEGICQYIKHGKPDRLIWLAQAFREKISFEKIHDITQIDPWFLNQISQIVAEEEVIQEYKKNLASVFKETWWEWKRMGFSDAAIAHWSETSEEEVRSARTLHGVVPAYKVIDSCAAEFESKTPYFYSTYEASSDELPSCNAKKIIILGSGPNRIGQGIEFDYCCVQASLALREEGYHSIFINCNPETVSTDYDISNTLYFEPLYLEDILNIIEREKPEGIVVHFGGQTPLNLSKKLAKYGVKILGTSAEAIEIAEDREKFSKLCRELGVKQPPHLTVVDRSEVFQAALKLGYPILVRPSFVLGGVGMEILYHERDFQRWLTRGIEISPSNPLLMDRFLNHAIEVDVDVLSDGEEVVICGVLEQIQEAGVHSGDSACSLPPMTLSPKIQAELESLSKKMALSLHVKGLLNIQYATHNGEIYVLEVNPRASRTVPFSSKASRVPFARLAMKAMLGKRLKDLPIEKNTQGLVYVKESVFPFNRFPGTDIILGPEMRSTGEVMGVGKTFAEAFGKATLGAGFRLPKTGNAFLSVKDADKEGLLPIAQELFELGFHLVATRGTAAYLQDRKIKVEVVNKVNEGRPHIVDKIKTGDIQLVINTSALGVQEVGAAYELRRATLTRHLCYFTTLAAARAGVQAIMAQKNLPIETYCFQS